MMNIGEIQSVSSDRLGNNVRSDLYYLLVNDRGFSMNFKNEADALSIFEKADSNPVMWYAAIEWLLHNGSAATRQAILTAMQNMPAEARSQMEELRKLKELVDKTPVYGYSETGERLYSSEEIVKQLGISHEELLQHTESLVEEGQNPLHSGKVNRPN
jgi:hypothetical protein